MKSSIRTSHGVTRKLLSLVVLAATLGLAQAPTSPVPSANQGASLTVAAPASVKDMVSIQAVMLPYTANKELFSKHIAENYVVIVVNVGNRSHDSALVLQGLYLNYCKWVLSGAVCPDGEVDKMKNYSAGTRPGEVSTVEYRIVRGELEERDPKTLRNWILRSLQLAGSVAGATTFVYSAASDIPKFLTAVNGVGIPGFEKLWPDMLISKLNRISDFGYHVNRIIPRESSDIMLAFFPIDRFLSPTLKALYISNPAMFFNTGLAVVDPAAPPALKKIIEDISQHTTSQLAGEISDVIKCQASHDSQSAPCRSSEPLRTMVAATSLNVIQVVIDGSMVIDLSAVPAVLDLVEFQDQTDKAAYWSTPTAKDPNKQVIVTGRYLDGARVTVEPAGAGIDSFTIDDKSSNSEKLVGNLKFSKPVLTGTALTIKVVKDTKDGRTVTSSPYPYTLKFDAEPPSDIKPSVSPDTRLLTLKGNHLASPTLSISLTRTKPLASTATLLGSPTVNADGSVSFDLKKQPGGCYDATLFAPDAVTVPQFFAPPSPVITTATQTTNHVEIKGTDLFAMADCASAAAQVAIKVLDDKGAASTIPPTNISAVDPKGATLSFDFAFPAGAAKWQVQVSAGAATSKAVTLTSK